MKGILGCIRRYIVSIIPMIFGVILFILSKEGVNDRLLITVGSIVGTISLAVTIKFYTIKIERVEIDNIDKFEEAKINKMNVERLIKATSLISKNLNVESIDKVEVYKENYLDDKLMDTLITMFGKIETSYYNGQTITIGHHYLVFIDFEFFVQQQNSNKYIFVNKSLNSILDDIKKMAIEFDQLYNRNIEFISEDSPFMRFKHYRLDRERHSINSKISLEDVNKSFDDLNRAEELIRLMVRKNNMLYKKYVEIANETPPL